MLRANVLSALLVGSISFSGSLAACGGNEAPPIAPVSNVTPPPTTAPSEAPVDASIATPPPAEPSRTKGAKTAMPAIRPSTLLAKLTEAGLDPKALPPMSKLSKTQRVVHMQLFRESLGIPCGECHQTGNNKAETRRTKIARKMWDEYVVKLTMANGEPVFCDSCHQGKVKTLDRTDRKALAQWMDENFEHGLKQKDGSEHGCESSQCHKDEGDQFLTKWAGGSL
jgi:hypothetical protein